MRRSRAETHLPRHAAPPRRHPVVAAAAGTVVVLGSATAALAAPVGGTSPQSDDTMPPQPPPVTTPAAPAVHKAASLPDVYTVQPGDTLSAIAEDHGLAGNWQGLWAANPSIANPNVITPGELIRLAVGTLTPAMSAELQRLLAPPPAAPQAPPATSAPPQNPQVVSASGTLSVSSFGGFEGCVISRESGGNPQVMNSTGHYGLFQFDYGTWVSGGGAPGDFGHASVAEQEQVFNNVYAARGTEPWAPSDGC
jgi:hypothetical protein